MNLVGAIVARHWIATASHCLPFRSYLKASYDREGRLEVVRGLASSNIPFEDGKYKKHLLSTQGPILDTVMMHEKFAEIDPRSGKRQTLGYAPALLGMIGNALPPISMHFRVDTLSQHIEKAVAEGQGPLPMATAQHAEQTKGLTGSPIFGRLDHYRKILCQHFQTGQIHGISNESRRTRV